MNYKIEIKYLNISNYPNVEKYLEDKAREGWLLKRIIRGIVFIFKKIEAEELEFSISPYEVETTFTRKTKGELEEFESVCQSVGWNYSTKSYDLHIYFKEKNSQSMDIHTDDEEEFNTLKRIGERQTRTNFILTLFLLVMAWFNMGKINSVYFMKNGLSQLMLILIPLGLLLSISDWVHIERFLDKNEENVELGKSIEYSNSKFYINRLGFIIVLILIIIIVAQVFYLSIYLKNRILAIALLPPIVGVIGGQFYRKFVKPRKISTGYKVLLLGITIFIAVWLANFIGILGPSDIDNVMESNSKLDREEYQVLLVEDFHENIKDKEVWFLSGKDFGDKDIIKVAKDKLKLD